MAWYAGVVDQLQDFAVFGVFSGNFIERQRLLRSAFGGSRLRRAARSAVAATAHTHAFHLVLITTPLGSIAGPAYELALLGKMTAGETRAFIRLLYYLT